MRAALAACVLALAAFPGAAQSLLGPREAAREIAIELRGGRVFLPAVVASSPGVMMFDTGTADAIFLDRDVPDLPPGAVLGVGRTADLAPGATAVLALSRRSCGLIFWRCRGWPGLTGGRGLRALSPRLSAQPAQPCAAPSPARSCAIASGTLAARLM